MVGAGDHPDDTICDPGLVFETPLCLLWTQTLFLLSMPTSAKIGKFPQPEIPTHVLSQEQETGIRCVAH